MYYYIIWYNTQNLGFGGGGGSLDAIFLGWPHEGSLVVGCLEATMTKFG